MTTRHLHREQRGFTLIEVMVTIGILGVVLAVLTTVLLSSTRQSGDTAKRADAQGATRQAMSLMTTELRQAGADPSIPPVGVLAIVSGDSVNIRVRSDLDGDGVIETAEPSEDVTYSYVDSTGVLSRNPGAGAAALISNVTDMRLTYYAVDGSVISALPLSTTDAARVTSIDVALTVAEDGQQPVTITNRVNLRNR